MQGGSGMKRIGLLAVCFMMMIGLALPAAALEVGVRGAYWLPDLSGDIRVDAGGVSGTQIDLEDDLAIDDDYYPWVEVFAGIGKHHLNLSYYNAQYEGENTLSRDIAFNGVGFHDGDKVATSLDYDMYDLMYQYDLLDLENILAGFSIGAVGRIKYVDGSVEMGTSSLKTKQNFSAPIPMVGLNLHVGILLDILEARILATGIGYGDGTIFDAQADISWTPFPFLDVHGGYRVFAIDFDVDDVEFNYTASGPFAAVTLSF